MVHVRREFFDLTRNGPAPIAEEALRRIAALYAVEAEARGKPPGVRRTARQTRSRVLVANLFTWLEAQLARLWCTDRARGRSRPIPAWVHAMRT
jgi:transposase